MFKPTPRAKEKSINTESHHTASTTPTTQDTDTLLEHDARLMLKNITVIKPEDFIRDNFGESALQRQPDDGQKQAFRNAMKNLFPAKKKAKITKPNLEAQMYEPLKEAFNKICPSRDSTDAPGAYVPHQDLKCLNVHSRRYTLSKELGWKKTLGPDLYLTFDTSNIQESNAPGGSDQQSTNKNHESIFNVPGITIEVKRDPDDDLPFSSEETVESTHRNKFNQKQVDLVRQYYSYVGLAQWSRLPYQFLWSISVAGPLLRLWRWCSTGCVVTDAISYCEDATIVYQFLQAVGRGAYSSLGLDIGLERTFSGVTDQKNALAKAAKVLECYSTAALPSSQGKEWLKDAKPKHLWIFEPSNMKSSYYILPYPISKANGIFTRATGAYIAISKSTFDAKDGVLVPFDIQDLNTLKLSFQHVSQPSEFSLFQRAQSVQNPHLATVLAAGSIPSSLQVFGQFIRLERTKSGAYNVEKNSPLGSTGYGDGQAILPPGLESQENWSKMDLGSTYSTIRELRWLLFEEVGGRIQNFRSIKEFLNSIRGAVTAHQLLLQSQVLHRDISVNNVMINLRTREGLLIDLDMAADLSKRQSQVKHGNAEASLNLVAGSEAPSAPPPSSPSNHADRDGSNAVQEESDKIHPRVNVTRPEITGTWNYISVALQAKPDHMSWHDLESFFWLLVWLVVRHVMGEISYEGTHDEKVVIQDDGERATILNQIFPNRFIGNESPLKVITERKKTFLRENTLTSQSYPELSTLIDQLRLKFRELHSTLGFCASACKQLRDINDDLGRPTCTLPTAAMIYSVGNISEIEDILANVETERDAVTERLKGMDKVTQRRVAVKLAGVSTDIAHFQASLKSVSNFPDHASFLQELDDALENTQDDNIPARVFTPPRSEESQTLEEKARHLNLATTLLHTSTSRSLGKSNPSTSSRSEPHQVQGHTTGQKEILEEEISEEEEKIMARKAIFKQPRRE